MWECFAGGGVMGVFGEVSRILFVGSACTLDFNETYYASLSVVKFIAEMFEIQ